MIRKVNILACCLLLGALLLTACHDYDCFDDKEIGLSQAERLANADSLYLNLSIVGNSIPAQQHLDVHTLCQQHIRTSHSGVDTSLVAVI